MMQQPQCVTNGWWNGSAFTPCRMTNAYRCAWDYDACAWAGGDFVVPPAPGPGSAISGGGDGGDGGDGGGSGGWNFTASPTPSPTPGGNGTAILPLVAEEAAMAPVTKLGIALGVLAGLLCLTCCIVVVVAGWYWRRRKEKKRQAAEAERRAAEDAKRRIISMSAPGGPDAMKAHMAAFKARMEGLNAAGGRHGGVAAGTAGLLAASYKGNGTVRPPPRGSFAAMATDGSGATTAPGPGLDAFKPGYRPSVDGAMGSMPLIRPPPRSTLLAAGAAAAASKGSASDDGSGVQNPLVTASRRRLSSSAKGQSVASPASARLSVLEKMGAAAAEAPLQGLAEGDAVLDMLPALAVEEGGDAGAGLFARANPLAGGGQGSMLQAQIRAGSFVAGSDGAAGGLSGLGSAEDRTRRATALAAFGGAAATGATKLVHAAGATPLLRRSSSRSLLKPVPESVVLPDDAAPRTAEDAPVVPAAAATMPLLSAAAASAAGFLRSAGAAIARATGRSSFVGGAGQSAITGIAEGAAEGDADEQDADEPLDDPAAEDDYMDADEPIAMPRRIAGKRVPNPAPRRSGTVAKKAAPAASAPARPSSRTITLGDGLVEDEEVATEVVRLRHVPRVKGDEAFSRMREQGRASQSTMALAIGSGAGTPYSPAGGGAATAGSGGSGGAASPFAFSGSGAGSGSLLSPGGFAPGPGPGPDALPGSSAGDSNADVSLSSPGGAAPGPGPGPGLSAGGAYMFTAVVARMRRKVTASREAKAAAAAGTAGGAGTAAGARAAEVRAALPPGSVKRNASKFAMLAGAALAQTRFARAVAAATAAATASSGGDGSGGASPTAAETGSGGDGSAAAAAGAASASRPQSLRISLRRSNSVSRGSARSLLSDRGSGGASSPTAAAAAGGAAPRPVSLALSASGSRPASLRARSRFQAAVAATIAAQQLESLDASTAYAAAAAALAEQEAGAGAGASV